MPKKKKSGKNKIKEGKFDQRQKIEPHYDWSTYRQSNVVPKNERHIECGGETAGCVG